MKKRILGKDLEVSAVGLGCMGFTHAYGLPADEAESEKAIARAVDFGYTFFDTAECYVEARVDGSIAHNEDLVGRALKPYRNQVKIITPAGSYAESFAMEHFLPVETESYADYVAQYDGLYPD